jgi:predicted Zn-dependent protease with MMP-like domain
MTATDAKFDWSGRSAPSLEDIAALGQAAFDALPPPFRRHVGEVVFRVDDFADDEALAALGLEDPFELSGLYQGVDLAHRSVLDPGGGVSQIFLYRRPLLDEWAERGDVFLGDLIAHVLIHEIGHHFGLSDADIEAIEAED